MEILVAAILIFLVLVGVMATRVASHKEDKEQKVDESWTLDSVEESQDAGDSE